MTEYKQVIVVRTDLRNTEGHKIRTGKIAAQVAHASLGAVLPYVGGDRDYDSPPGQEYLRRLATVQRWLNGPFTKTVLQVDSLEKLVVLERQAKEASLIHCLITDNGTTEFGGVKTVTCLAIGPDTKENIDNITGGLKPL